MALKDEFAEEGCFTTEQGAFTLTIEDRSQQIMIPWISFRHAVWKEKAIELHFNGWRVDILGERLGELWKELQQQNVLTICKSVDTQAVGCVICSLEVTFGEGGQD